MAIKVVIMSKDEIINDFEALESAAVVVDVVETVVETELFVVVVVVASFSPQPK